MCLYLFKKSEGLDARRTPTTYKELKQNPNNSEDLLAETLLRLQAFWCLPLSSFFLASPGSTWTSWRMRGRLVTIPVPRGSRSLPTRLSSTELLPLLWKNKTEKETGVRWGINQGLRLLSDWTPQIQHSPDMKQCCIWAAASRANCTFFPLKPWPNFVW